jgi:SAM-dependent methyltransferase
LDREVATGPREDFFVRGDAAALPFRDQTFKAVISNHSLEHFDDLDGALREIGRVIHPAGMLFVSVPDASTLTDKIYRWQARSGGHVNAFKVRQDLAVRIERATGLRHVGTRVLCSSLSFLNRRNSHSPRPRRLILLGAGYEWSLLLYTWLSRRIDRLLNQRTSVYGWAFYFGENLAPDTETWSNVCVMCGSGHPSSSLRTGGRVIHHRFLPAVYRCPQCNTRNFFTDDNDLQHLR